MATGESGDTLESWLNKASDQNNPAERQASIQGFYELVNKETHGPQSATRLLACQIQSPQEAEALHALTVLEACMNNCGKKFHCEAGKFRFLNELIKVLSPKYLGVRSSAQVKQKVTEILYGWTLWLKDEPKIQEAYRMLKKQGIVKKDPTLPNTDSALPLSPPPNGSTFDDGDRSKVLARLLKSDHVEDLQMANRLIKTILREEQEKMDKVAKRVATLEEVANSTKQLRELLSRHHEFGPTPAHTEDMKVLYQRCDGLRPNLFRLASDNDDSDDAALAQVLQANDDLTSVLTLYKETMQGGQMNKTHSSSHHAPLSPSEVKTYHLIDLSSLEFQSTNGGTHSRSSPQIDRSQPAASTLLDMEMTLLDLDDPVQTQSQKTMLYESKYPLLLRGLGRHSNAELTSAQRKAGPNTERGEELLELGGGVCSWGWAESDFNRPTLRSRSSSSGFQNQPISTSEPSSQSQNYTIREKRSSTLSLSQPIETPGSPLVCQSSLQDRSLVNVFVSLGSVRPSRLNPVTMYDRAGVHITLHFAQDHPSGRPDVAVVIVSTVNTSTRPVVGVVLQAAVPKTMAVKLQPATGKDLPPYNPLLPPSSLSQLVLLANPLKRKVRLRYKLTFTHGEQGVSEMGEVDDLPDWVSWLQH